MCKYTCALLTFLMLVVLPVYPFQTEGGFQQITSPEAAKRAASTGDQEKPRFEVISIKLASPKPTSFGRLLKQTLNSFPEANSSRLMRI